MTTDAGEKLRAEFPELYSEAFNVSPPPGWYELVRELSEALKPWPEIRVAQVKSKFGGLRFYVGAATPEAFELISAAENASMDTCEECGAPGKLVRARGWVFTVCEAHR